MLDIRISAPVFGDIEEAVGGLLCLFWGLLRERIGDYFLSNLARELVLSLTRLFAGSLVPRPPPAKRIKQRVEGMANLNSL